MWNLPDQERRMDFSLTEGHSPGFLPPRLVAALLLVNRNPHAAQNLLPQPEAEELYAPFSFSDAGILVCKGDANKLPSIMRSAATLNVNPRCNPYALLALNVSTNKPTADPHTVLRSNKTPAMILRGECDFIAWSDTLDYRRTLRNAKIYHVLKAGHFIQFEQPELMQAMILAFLQDQPDFVAPYLGDDDPRTVHP
jgi:proline iminopeptidase